MTVDEQPAPNARALFVIVKNRYKINQRRLGAAMSYEGSIREIMILFTCKTETKQQHPLENKNNINTKLRNVIIFGINCTFR